MVYRVVPHGYALVLRRLLTGTANSAPATAADECTATTESIGGSIDNNHTNDGADGEKANSAIVTPPAIKYRNIPPSVAKVILAGNPHALPQLSAQLEHAASLITVHFSLLSRGVPVECARVYRLPKSDTALRSQWLLLMSQATTSTKVRDPFGTFR